MITEKKLIEVEDESNEINTYQKAALSFNN